MARNIVFVAERFEDFGGREIFLSALLRALQAAGHRCTLVCQRTQNSLLAELAASGARLLFRPRLIDGTGPLFGISVLPALASIMREADVLVFTRPVSPFCFRIGRFLARVKSNPKLIFLTTIRPAEAWRRRRWPPRLLDHFDAVITQSPVFQSDLRRYGYEGAIHVIPYLMPDVAPVCPFPSLERTVRLGFLGRLLPEKNLEYLFEVILALIRGSTRSTNVSYEFHIFGDGPHRTKCERLVRKLRLEDLVIFHGFLPHAQIFSSIDTCHLFLFAPYSAGQCLAALEVLSRGRPMVATPAGALPDIISDPEIGRLTSRLRDHDAFLAAIKEVIVDIEKGLVRPQWLRQEYDRKYSRAVILPKYLEVLAGLENNTIPRKET